MNLENKTQQFSGLDLIRQGVVIPAHPLALNEARDLDERRQIALTRYYLDSGVGGIAVGVHTTQFAIREKGLFQKILKLTAETSRTWPDRTVALVAGLAGSTVQAVNEAAIASAEGYDAGLLSLVGLPLSDEDEIIHHCRCVSREIPVIGFYMQQAVGGRKLSSTFWQKFSRIENVIGIKIAPFDRYATIDVIRGVIAAEAENRIVLYTGNDDNILIDLAVPFLLPRGNKNIRVDIKGGLLGHWSVWTHSAVKLFDRIRQGQQNNNADLLALHAQITDCNSAFFDVANNFHGCIAGCHEVLRRQGLFEGIWCLDPKEGLGPGQREEIDRVYREYPELNDDAFVSKNLEKWLS